MCVISGLFTAATTLASWAAMAGSWTAGIASSVGSTVAANSSWLVPTALGVGGAAAGATQMVSGIQNANAQMEMAEFQADQEDANRRMYERQARDITEQGEWEKRSLALEAAARLGKARNNFGASGAALGSGSLLTFEEDAAQTRDLDKAQLDYDIKGRAWQSKMAAWNSENQAEAYRYAAKGARAQRGWAIGSGILGTAISAAGGVATGMSWAKDFASASGSLIQADGSYGATSSLVKSGSPFGINPKWNGLLFG